jgi:hypothetical protein
MLNVEIPIEPENEVESIRYVSLKINVEVCSSMYHWEQDQV